jgi:tetratricopeptide (TPR) repeat protein
MSLSETGSGTSQSGRGPVYRVSYVSADRVWAEWLQFQLESLGIAVDTAKYERSADDPADVVLARNLIGVDRLLLVINNGHFRVPGPTAEDLATAIAAHDGRVIPVIVGRDRLPGAPSQITLLNLTEDDARRRLRTSLDTTRAAIDPDRSAVRFPGEQPEIWSGHIPPRNIHFVGRSDLLQSLRAQLDDSATALLPHTLQGMGGVGKTQIAVEYAYRYASDYDLVWWVRAETPAQVRQDLSRLAVQLGIPPNDDLSNMAFQALQALRRGKPYLSWLLIYDNATLPKNLERFIISNGPGHTLITSRNPEWSKDAQVLEVNLYPREESLRFIARRAPNVSSQDAVRLADEMGDLPLALEAAAAWLNTTRLSTSQFLTLTSNRLTSVLDSTEIRQYQRSALLAWTVSMNQLRDEVPAAAQLIRLSSFLAAEPIPLTFFDAPGMDLPEPLNSQIHGIESRGQILHKVAQYGIAKVTNPDGRENHETIQLHRVVQAIVREGLSQEEFSLLERMARRLLATLDPGNPDAQAHWGLYAELYPHVRASHAEQAADEPAVRQLVINLVRYLDHRGEFSAGAQLAGDAKRNWALVLEPTEPDVVALDNHLANCLRAAGDHHGALELDEQNVVNARRLLGAGHREAIRAANGLAASLRRAGQWRRAFEVDRDAFEQSTASLGSDHLRTLQAEHNFAVSQRMMGNFTEALALDEDVLRRREMNQTGRDTPQVLFTLNNIARDERECGNYLDATQLQEHTYARYQRMIGEGLPDTLRARKNLAVSLRKSGRYQEALELSRQSLALYRARVGIDHVDSLASLVNLANDLRMTGDLFGAQEAAGEAHRRLQEQLGETHPHTLAAATNRAVVIRLLGDQQSALALDRRTHASFAGVGADAEDTDESQALGPAHPYTLACQTNLASDLRAVGQIGEAAELGRHAHRLLIDVRGATHPYTLACASNLALDLLATDDDADTEAGEDLRTQTILGYADRIGADHPETLAAQRGERIDCDIEPPPM